MPPGNGQSPRILVTGTGGPSGFSFMRALRGESLEFLSADIDPHAPGLFLVDTSRRVLLPRGDDPGFVEAVLEVCRERVVDAVVPTVDSELVPLAESRDEFAAAGVSVLVAPTRALRLCLDKWALMQIADGSVPIPRSAPLDDDFDPTAFELPVLVKPRVGSGSRGVRRVNSGTGSAASGTGPCSSRSTCRAPSTPSTYSRPRRARYVRWSLGSDYGSIPESRSPAGQSTTTSSSPSALEPPRPPG